MILVVFDLDEINAFRFSLPSNVLVAIFDFFFAVVGFDGHLGLFSLPSFVLAVILNHLRTSDVVPFVIAVPRDSYFRVMEESHHDQPGGEDEHGGTCRKCYGVFQFQ